VSTPSLLVVDDEPANFDVIERYLDDRYLLHYASSGFEALETLELTGVDLILLDVMMPGLDGLEVCKRIKDNPQWRMIPILMITALTSKEDLARGIAVGADDFLSKPVNSLELRARVMSLLRIKSYHDEIQRCHARALSFEQERAILLQGRASELEEQVRQRTASLNDAMEALAHNALHDPLTNLPNRRMLIERLQACIRQNLEFRHVPYAVLFLDIDKFSEINDSVGHIVGDEILASFSQRLASAVEPKTFIARFGGDEFVILIAGHSDPAVIMDLARHLKGVLEQPVILRGRSFVLGASIGIVHGSELYQEANQLLSDADLAMYQAKKDGGGCAQVFDAAMRRQLVRKYELVQDLRQALEQGELIPYYQPIIDLRQDRCIGFEALARWRHPVRGLVSPCEFIPLAEDAGLLPSLTRQILHQACHQLAAWTVRFPEALPLKMNINIGAQDLASSSLLEDFDQALRSADLEASSVTVEVTESGFIENFSAATSVAEQLRSRGLQIAIDDFGTGYSSLAYLRRLPVSIVKIDRSFVSQMHLDDRSYSIVDSIVALGKRMGFQIVAEGLETSEHLKFLRLLGCDFGQGYLFSRPLPAEEIETTLLQGSAMASLGVTSGE
jgi:diguanylate cyclase (GGDEF)-like protein